MLIGLSDRNLADSDSTLGNILKDKGTVFSVILAHEPQYIHNYTNAKADLVLTGHAHGGQFRLPLFGGIVAPDQGFNPAYTQGEYSMDNTNMIVNRGLGNSIIPIRLWNYPEIVCVVLGSK